MHAGGAQGSARSPTLLHAFAIGLLGMSRIIRVEYSQKCRLKGDSLRLWILEWISTLILIVFHTHASDHKARVEQRFYDAILCRREVYVCRLMTGADYSSFIRRLFQGKDAGGLSMPQQFLYRITNVFRYLF